MKTVFIYALNDPNRQHLGKTRYIGKAVDPYARYELHLDFNAREKTHKASWIRSLLRIGQTPILEILDEVPEAEWSFWEREWIRLYRALGFQLTNGNDGGEGSHNPSDEARAKMSAARSGKNHPMFGKSHSAETRAKMSASHVGKTHSVEARAKIRAAKLGKNHPMFGKSLSLEVRAKISAASSGENNYMFGKHHSPETRAKMSAARRKTKTLCKSFD